MTSKKLRTSAVIFAEGRGRVGWGSVSSCGGYVLDSVAKKEPTESHPWLHLNRLVTRAFPASHFSTTWNPNANSHWSMRFPSLSSSREGNSVQIPAFFRFWTMNNGPFLVIRTCIPSDRLFAVAVSSGLFFFPSSPSSFVYAIMFVGKLERLTCLSKLFQNLDVSAGAWMRSFVKTTMDIIYEKKTICFH